MRNFVMWSLLRLTLYLKMIKEFTEHRLFKKIS